jgi:hypothetical protein
MDEEINALNNTKKKQTTELKSSKLENDDEEYIEAPIGERYFFDSVLISRYKYLH